MSRDDPGLGRLSLLLSFQLNLNSFTNLAAECLEIISRKASTDTTLLYACVLEAQNSGNKRQTIHALEKALQKFNHNVPPGANLPALLR